MESDGDSVVVSTLLTTVRAIATVLVVYVAGFLLVHFKKIDPAGVSGLSNLANVMFLPSLLFIRLGGNLNLELLEYAWPLPVIGLVTTIVYFLVSNFILVPLAKPSPEFKKWFNLGQSIPNVFALPLVFVSSICEQIPLKASEFFQATDDVETSNRNNCTVLDESSTKFLSQSECVELGELYIFLFALFISLLLFTVGQQYVSENTSQTRKTSQRDLESVDNDELEKAVPKSSPPSTSICSSCFPLIKSVFTRPPNVAQIIGLIVGLNPNVQDFFFTADAPLQPLTSGLNVLAGGTLSILNIIMACTLALKIKSLNKLSDIFGNEDSVGISTRTLLVYAFGRMVIVPGVMIGIFVAFNDNILPDDDLMKFVVYLATCMPTANLVVLLAQIVDQRENAEILAMAGLMQFIIGLFSLTGFLFASLFSLEIVS